MMKAFEIRSRALPCIVVVKDVIGVFDTLRDLFKGETTFPVEIVPIEISEEEFEKLEVFES